MYDMMKKQNYGVEIELTGITREQAAKVMLELLGWARKGLAAEKAKWREMQGKAAEGGAGNLVQGAQEKIEEIEVKEQSVADLEEIHNRRY